MRFFCIALMRALRRKVMKINCIVSVLLHIYIYIYTLNVPFFRFWCGIQVSETDTITGSSSEIRAFMTVFRWIRYDSSVSEWTLLYKGCDHQRTWERTASCETLNLKTFQNSCRTEKRNSIQLCLLGSVPAGQRDAPSWTETEPRL